MNRPFGIQDRLGDTVGRFAYKAWVFLVFAFVALPLVVTFAVAVFADRTISFPPSGFSFQWFSVAFTSETFRDAFVLSIQLAFGTMIGGLLFGIPAAVAIARNEFRGKEFIQTLLLSPLMIPAVVIGAAVFLYFIELEILTGIQFAGTFYGLLLAHILVAIPWVVRLVTASLVGMDRSVEEASANLGATPLVTFVKITLPIIKPAIVAAALFSFVFSFADLEKSMFLVGPGRQTLSVAILTYLEWSLDPTIMAVAAAQILIIGVALVISDHYVKLSRAF